MSTKISPLRRFLAAFANSLDPRAATKAFSFGVLVWVAAMLVLGASSERGNVLYGLIEDTHSNWQVAFLWSIAAVALASVVDCVRTKKGLLSVLSNTIVYTSPYALLLLGIWSLDAVYAQHPATIETMSILGPIFVIFYVIGILYMRLRAAKGRDESLPFFVLPTFTVVILLLGMTTYKLFTSNDYIYRDAFQLTIKSVDRSADAVKIRGVLTLNKAGNYSFQALSNEMRAFETDMPQPLKIEWSASENMPSSEGEYEFFINLPNSRISHNQRHRAPNTPPDIDWGGPEAYFQISLNPSEPQSSRTFLKSIPIWFDEFVS